MLSSATGQATLVALALGTAYYIASGFTLVYSIITLVGGD
jgi:hypothetical protein